MKILRKRCQLSDTKCRVGHKCSLPDVMCLLIASYKVNPQLLRIVAQVSKHNLLPTHWEHKCYEYCDFLFVIKF